METIRETLKKQILFESYSGLLTPLTKEGIAKSLWSTKGLLEQHGLQVYAFGKADEPITFLRVYNVANHPELFDTLTCGKYGEFEVTDSSGERLPNCTILQYLGY